MTAHLTARRGLIAAMLLLLVATVGAPANPVSGHAYLDRSDPQANDIVEVQPDEVRLWFTEPLEPDHSFALLYDAMGNEIETEDSQIVGDDFQMVLPLPEDLPNGTYTVQWRNISTVDGHPQSGFFAFTIGSEDDVAEPASPPEDATTGDPGLIEPLGRWFSFLGITAAVGTVFAWLWVIRPALYQANEELLPRARRNAQRLAIGGLLLAVAGSVLGLVAQTVIVTRGFSLPDLTDTWFGTQYGVLWTLRVLQFVVLGVILASGALWRQRRVRRTGWFALVVALLALLPFSMSSHAAAEPIGRYAAIAADWLHLTASSVWVGGLIAIVAAGVVPLRGMEPESRRAVFARLIPRFSTLAIASVVILGLTGIYAAWLQVGSLHALFETDYGRLLALKLALIVPLILLGAVHLLLIGPWMERAARAGRPFGRTVAAEAVLGVAVLAVVAVLVSTPPARDTLESEAERTAFELSRAGLSTAIYISPGAVGQNRYTADLTPEDGELAPETEVFLRVSSDEVLGGVREIELSPSGEDIGSRSVRYESIGTDLSVAGSWDVEVVVFRPGASEWRAGRTVDIPEVPSQDQVPAPPIRLDGIQAIGAPIGLALAIVFGTVALRRRLETEPDRVLGWLAVILVVFSGLSVWQNKITPTPTAQLQNPVLMSADSIETGRALYEENCQQCHGPNGQGDGPMASELSQQPADLTGPHVGVHPDGDLYWWITDGVGSEMPGFGEELSEREIWHLVNYVRSLRD